MIEVFSSAREHAVLLYFAHCMAIHASVHVLSNKTITKGLVTHEILKPQSEVVLHLKIKLIYLIFTSQQFYEVQANTLCG